MSVEVGQSAPPFTARSDDGREVQLPDPQACWTVLYFYPRASTPGCSLEAGHFEQALPEFERLNAQVIGVSTDTEASQARFRDSCGLSFALLPDGDKNICRAYGVLGGFGGLLGLAARQTFLIDPAGKVAYVWKQVSPAGHAAEVLRELGSRTANS